MVKTIGKTCAEFQQEIDKHFRFLLNDKGFKVVRVLESTRDRCLIVLASDRFQIKIYQTIDEINVLLGDRFASRTWEDTREGEREWYYLYSTSGFLSNNLGAEISDRVRGKQPQDRTHERQFAVLAELLERQFHAIDELFGSGGLERLRPVYEEYFRRVDD